MKILRKFTMPKSFRRDVAVLCDQGGETAWFQAIAGNCSPEIILAESPRGCSRAGVRTTVYSDHQNAGKP
jgi:hypothetical protein